MSLRRAWRVAIVVVGGGAVAVVLALVDPGTNAAGLAALGTGIVVGELLPLRPPLRAQLPLSTALFVVLASEVGFGRYALIVGLAEVVALVIGDGSRRRWPDFAARLVVAAAAYGVFAAVEAIGPDHSEGTELVAALVASIVALLTAELAELPRSHLRASRLPRALPLTWSGRSADLVIVSSAVLMTATTSGRDDAGLGLWALGFCAIPLLMAWYAMERLGAARRTYDQSIETLASLPERLGWVPVGRAHRIGHLSIELGEELGLEAWELDRLTTAALLRELGRVCLDDPSDPERVAIAAAGARILGATAQLAPAGAILGAELEPGGAPAPQATAGTVLAAVALFEDASGGRWATSPDAREDGLAAVRRRHETRVVNSFERVLASL